MTVDELIEYISSYPSSSALRINGCPDISITLKCVNDAYIVELDGVDCEDDK